MLFLFLIAIPAVVIFLLKNYRKIGVRVHNHPPGPPGLPLVANLYQLNKESLHKYLWQLSKKYGPLMSMKLGFSQVVVISSAKIAKEAMKTHDIAFSGKPSFPSQQKLSYNGLDISFSSYGAYWREIRNICVIHLFNTKKVQSFRPIRVDEVSRMINHVTELASMSKLVNLSEIILSLSSSIICRVGFGKRYDEKGDEKRRFHKLLREAEAVLGDFFVSHFFPIFGWVNKVNGKVARLEKIYNELDLFYQELIEEHLSPTRPKSMDGDILDTSIVLRDQTLSSSLTHTWDHIKAVLMLEAAGFGGIALTIGLRRCDGRRSDKGVADARIVLGEENRRSGDLGAYAMPQMLVADVAVFDESWIEDILASRL
uniref:Cytochrome P450 83B1-like n=1 Tax=Nicotiana tabacum TaxID=4097 RepID=A0A1S3YN90_TOBAC|nr:PREDICTED: cytochrome P450 83B1-like [Nicotiana tabacum]